MLPLVLLLLLLSPAAARGEEVPLPGLEQKVEILRDRWGIPHIYASTVRDLFFAQGYMAARDRLFQIDLWRRIGTGKLSEVLGRGSLERDRIARLVRYRGDWNAEWESYAPDAKLIVTAFVDGINAYIDSLQGQRPLEFRLAGYDPGRWVPEDCAARVAGLLMTRNLAREVSRAEDIHRFGLAAVQRFTPPDPMIKIEIPTGLDVHHIRAEILRSYNAAIGQARVPPVEGSNNWVVSGAKSVTRKPLLASDPHRSIQIPSLRKTVHLVGPGWNAIGAGEPALPGIALGHNESMAFGFTIVSADQQDLYVEKLNPANRDEYWYQSGWRKVETERQQIRVKGRSRPETVTLRYTVHGPIIHEESNRAYALKWVGTEPGTAGYLAGISLARARDWKQFQAAVARWKVPAENILYADVKGNIGWMVAGLVPVRKNWSGLLPVPGHTGEYEWSGFMEQKDLPQEYNPKSGFLATANHNILPKGYPHAFGYDWAPSFRFEQIHEFLSEPKKRFSIEDFQRLQQDIESIPARRFQEVLRQWEVDPKSRAGRMVSRILNWNARLHADSFAAAVFEVWQAHWAYVLFGPGPGTKAPLPLILEALEKNPDPHVLSVSLDHALADLERRLGRNENTWNWGRLHTVTFRHPLENPPFHRGPFARPGDYNTVNATGGSEYRQESGASYRQICDLQDWDRSVMTNAPGESGNPRSPYYDNLLQEWLRGEYHPMYFSRRAIEGATVERIYLLPRLR